MDTVPNVDWDPCWWFLPSCVLVGERSGYLLIVVAAGAAVSYGRTSRRLIGAGSWQLGRLWCGTWWGRMLSAVVLIFDSLISEGVDS